MDLRRFRDEILHPGLDILRAEGGPARSRDADRMMLAIALQESGLRSRYQLTAVGAPGPARGWWQFERMGGVAGVMSHSATKGPARALCDRYGVRLDSADVWRAIEGHDGLATGFARLLLWSDPRPLPTTEAAGWDYYLRTWRPGKPHRYTWATNWAQATAATE